jgi:hypothetical protein
MNARFRLYPEWSWAKSGILALGLLEFACTPSPEKNKTEVLKAPVTKPSVVKKPPSSFVDTVIINSRSAVFYNPDTFQLKKIKSTYDKRVYDTQTHDCYYMMQNARNVIREHWPKLPVMEVNKARYLLFIKKDGHRMCIDLNTRSNMCGMYLFDPQKDPVPVDMPNVATWLGFYFEK